ARPHLDAFPAHGQVATRWRPCADEVPPGREFDEVRGHTLDEESPTALVSHARAHRGRNELRAWADRHPDPDLAAIRCRLPAREVHRDLAGIVRRLEEGLAGRDLAEGTVLELEIHPRVVGPGLDPAGERSFGPRVIGHSERVVDQPTSVREHGVSV